MMKVGIIGYWYATNYGSACTYYALYRTLEKIGYEPIIIEIPERENERGWDESFARKFINSHCMVSESVRWDDTKRVNEFCDAFVIGSDQVWNKDAYRISHKFFFLDFADDGHLKIAYAPSFGSDTMLCEPEMEADIGRLLSRFDSISVREDSGKDILDKRFGIRSKHVIDPVFLLSREEYADIASDMPDLPDRFILAYILDPTEDKEVFISKVIEQYNLPLILILDGRLGTFDKNKGKLKRYADNVIVINDVEDWLCCFKRSEVVVTDSFHGMSIGLMNEKQTYVYANHGRGYSRFVSLLKSINLEHIMFESSEQYRSLDIDFIQVRQALESNIHESIDWLKNSLNADRHKNCIDKKMNIKLNCCGCGVCRTVCPVDAIELSENREGFYNPVIDHIKCIDCGICSDNCAVLNPRYDNEEKPDCYVAWANDDIRSISSSGGIFTVLAEQILSKGGSVYGAAYTNEFTVEHIRVTNSDELGLLRGSKYIQSRVDQVYLTIKNDLDSGKTVLFSGMPCQIAGLHKYLSKDYSNLFTIDLLCHGISSNSVFKKYQSDVFGGKVINDLQFKAKKPWGWHAGVNAKFTDDTTYSCIIEEDPYFRAYIKGISKNTICGKCQFNKVPRQGDITIGDFWKIQEYNLSYNDNKGTSLVLLNNDKGRDLFGDVADNLQLCEEVPIKYAIAGNGCIIYPYKLNSNRNLFFDRLNVEDFTTNVNSVLGNLYPKSMPISFPYRYRSLYNMCSIVFKNYNHRKIALWGDCNVLRSILYKYFGIRVDYIISSTPIYSHNIEVKTPDYLSGKVKELYVICYGKPYSKDNESFFENNSYICNKDYVYRSIKPIVLENYDLSIPYNDEYGNRVEGTQGIVKKIILRGYNNYIHLGSNVSGLENLIFDVTANTRIDIGQNTMFTQPDVIVNVQGFDGRSNITIGKHCRFMSALIRVFNSIYASSVYVGDNTTFGDLLRMHINSGKRLVINKNSMISREVVFWCGDGHSIFDVETGKNINSIYTELSLKRNTLILGEHVWVGDGAMLMHGTDIGDGSIVGAKAVVKKVFGNNCSIGGNPAKLIKENIAWAVDMCAQDISSCGQYANKTVDCKSLLSGANVLVIGGTQKNGINLVNALLSYGNTVTIANRGNKKDSFGDNVDRIIVDVTKGDMVRDVFKGRYYDVVFNNVAYSSNSVRNILTNVKCGRYVQLSSNAVYGSAGENVSEDRFNLDKHELIWSNATGDYMYNKRIAELAAHSFKSISSVCVRAPYVYYTDRLDIYCDSILNEKPINDKNLDSRFNFVTDWELSKFLLWVANQDLTGPVNIACKGTVSNREILTYIEDKVGKKAILDINCDNKLPFSGPSMNTDLITSKGYKLEPIESWIWRALDGHIARAKERKG